MRIIGGHDYYDGAVPFDTDRSRVFLRDAKEYELIPTERFELRVSKPVEDSKYVYNYPTVVHVVFCGKYYRGIAITRTPKRIGYATGEDIYVWSVEKLREFFVFEKRPPWRYPIKDKMIFEEDLKAFFTPRAVSENEFQALLGGKVFVAVRIQSKFGDQLWSVNSDMLKSIGFASIMPPWQAYQELEMFLGVILAGDESKMVQVSDKTKLSKYGFDKWSFKNPLHRGKPRGNK